jgi:pimeloyl-ACP methyl ester carboxylesterase
MQQPAFEAASTSSTPAKPRSNRRWLVLNLSGLILLLVGYGLSFLQVSTYEAGIVRQTFTVAGAIPVPVISLHPATRRGDAIAVIVHGYSGNKEVMIGFGLELARMGVPSYLLDLPGHGESTVPLEVLPDTGPAPQLEQALDEVVAYARAHSDVPQPKIILLGHSLGTRVVGDYALNQPNDAIAATILVSPILQESPTLTHPSNLLVLVGEHDIPSIITRSPQLIGAGCGVSLGVDTPRYDCGAVGQGTARRLVVVPGVNHITILTDAAAFRAMDAWVGATDAIPTVPVDSDVRLHWTELGVACAFLALFPLISLLSRLLTRRGAPALQTTAQVTPEVTPEVTAQEVTPGGRADRPALWASLGIFALGVVLTVLLLRGWAAAADALQLPGLRTPLSWIGVALADYSASFSLVLALIVGGLIAALRRRLPLPAFAAAWRRVALGALVLLVLYATVGTLATYAWERFLLDVPRLVRGIPLTLAGAPLFLLIEGLFAADQRGQLWRSALARLGAYLLICAGIIGAISLDPALGFLSLLVPLEVLLFVAVASLAWQIDRQRRQLSLSSAILATLMIGWAIAAVSPSSDKRSGALAPVIEASD